MARNINPFTDFGFKKLFGEEGSKEILIGFLNDVLPRKSKIIDIIFKTNEQQGDLAVERKAVYDIFCSDDQGNQFIVEMQNARQTYFKDRSIFYSTFPIREQAEKGEWNFLLKEVYCVGVLGFEMDRDDDYFHTVQLKDQRNKVFYEKLTFIYIELPKFNKKEYQLESSKDKWLYFLKNLEDINTLPDILKEQVFQKALEKARVANFSHEELMQYEMSLKVFRDNINVIQTARAEGKAEGKAEGRGELLIKQMARKLGPLPEEIERRLKEATIEQMDMVGENIFEISSLEELLEFLVQ